MSASSAGEKLELADASARPAKGQGKGASTYGQILKSSALIGGSSAISFVIGAVRTKAMAVLLGPAGIGLNGLFYSLQEFAKCLAAMGITTSGVRQIAAAVGTGDEQTIARTALVLRRTSLVLGVMAALVMAVFAVPIAVTTFTSEGIEAAKHAPEVALLGIAVMLATISGGQGALLQGTRRIREMAWIGVVSAGLAVAATLPLIYFWGTKGIVPSLIAAAGITSVFSWWYSRKIPLAAVVVTAREARTEAVALLWLGLSFLISGLLTMGSGLAIRTMVSRMDGMDAAGFYQSAWALAGMYATVVLQAMGADFYPRLAGVASDDRECNRLVNEQAQVSLLLSGPGLIATLTLAPLVIAIFYAPKFEAAVEPLRWICLGMALRVLSWPLGFIIVAKAQQVRFIAVEVLATTVHVGLAYAGTKLYGVRGAAMAYLGLYVVHCTVIYCLIRRTTGFRWSPENIRVGACMLSLTLSSFLAFEFLPFWPATCFGIAAALVAGLYALRRLTRLVPMERLPGPVRKLAAWLKITPPTTAH